VVVMRALSRFLVSSLVAAVVLAGQAAAERPVAGTIVLERGKRPVSLAFTASTSGEALLTVRADSDADWAREGAESAVVSVTLDGGYAGDLVVLSQTPTERQLALGSVGAGAHTLEFRFADDRSPAGTRKAKLGHVRVEVVPPADSRYLALRHAPILYGRSIPVANVEGPGTTYSGPFQNARTDTPLLAWHESSSAGSGNQVLEYSVVWSNEDGGTNSPALMARWGRTTDIEWIYRVEVALDGSRVPGTAVFQGPNHVTTPFAGGYEGDHPILQTCTDNNNVCQVVADARMRFFLSTEATRPADRAREVVMDQNPWSYPAMAAEMIREGRIEAHSDPATPALGDQRTYLYLEIDKDTTPPNAAGPWIGTAVGVRLAGDPTVYRSDHMVSDWSINRDVPAATTVELPAGTTAADVVDLIAYRVPVGGIDVGSSVTVTHVNRAFFLGQGFLPQPSFISWAGAVTLTAANPSATIWSAP
jgi:hypothetical protein